MKEQGTDFEITESYKMKYYVEESNSATKRSRKIVLLLIFSSVIAFAAYWNSRPGGWPQQRFITINKAYEKFVLENKKDTLDSSYLLFNGKKIKDSTLSRDSFMLVDFLSQRSINTMDELEQLKKIYFDIKENTYSVKIPILGVSFDINDLGLFTGITLSLILFLLCFCLERECANLKMTFKEADTINELEGYYKILSMSQVLTVPAKNNTQPNLIWQIISKMPYAFPFFVQLLICLNDHATSNVVRSISDAATVTYNLANDLSIFIISSLTITCIIYIIRIDLVWSKYHKKLYPSE